MITSEIQTTCGSFKTLKVVNDSLLFLTRCCRCRSAGTPQTGSPPWPPCSCGWWRWWTPGSQWCHCCPRQPDRQMGRSHQVIASPITMSVRICNPLTAHLTQHHHENAQLTPWMSSTPSRSAAQPLVTVLTVQGAQWPILCLPLPRLLLPG